MNPLLLDFPDTIETPRLIIRTPRAGDGAKVYEAVAETIADLRQWPASLPWALLEPSVSESESFCRSAQAAFITRRDLPMLIFLKEGNIFVGGTGLHRMNWDVPKFEVGYWCRKSLQNKGLSTEAAQAVTDFAFHHLGARRVESLPDTNNTPSRKVAEHCGYQLEGILVNERKDPDGKLRNTCVYAITAA
jgi:RimJ/RimL family protein N-acetyltransferase